MTTDPALDPARAFEESPFDFSGYLARRFGVSSEAATSDLGHWLARYEPRSTQQPAAATRDRMFSLV